MKRTLCWLISLFLFPLPLWSAPLSPQLQAVMSGAVAPLPVIVRLRGTDARASVQGLARGVARRTLITVLKQQARQSQGALVDFLRSQGVHNPRKLWLINGLAFTASPQLIAQLQSWPDIELISFDQAIPRPVVVPAAVSGNEWNIELIGAPQLWAQGFDGGGVVVASLDTGVDLNHPDLVGSWRGGSNSWFDPYGGSLEPYDPENGDLSQGHGTAVMGLMVGDSGIGVAPGARWIAAKIYPDSGLASNSVILEALGWVLDPDGVTATADGADIVNNSWGFDTFLDRCLPPEQSTNYQVALANLRLAGTAVVFSAGNTGPLTASSIPLGNMSGVTAVGAVDSRSEVALFSARGPSPCDAPGEIFPSLTAPGVSVLSASLTSTPFLYEYVSGTSFSAPQVAGSLALLRQAFPLTSTAELELAVRQMALDLGPQGADDIYGSGLLDVAAAYNLLAGVSPVLVIIDPVPPTDDGLINFGSVPPVTSRNLSLVLKNGGGGSLAITGIDDSAFSPEFAIAHDLCSGRLLAGGESCSVDLSFAPTELMTYSSVLTLSSDDSLGTHVLTLTGTGNTPPPTPVLILPANGSVNLTRPVTFSWQRGADLDGDSVEDFLLISAHGDFSDSTPIPANLPAALMLLASGGLCFGLLRRGGLRTVLVLLLLFVLALLQFSCGGGGSATPATLSLSPTGKYQADSLLPNATYYWKVRAEDERGGVSESSVRSFTTL